MKIPNFVHDRIVKPDGKLTEQWQQYISQLEDELQSNLSDDGYVLPQQTEAFIDTYLATTPQTEGVSVGTVIWDSTLNEARIKKADGDFHTLLTS